MNDRDDYATKGDLALLKQDLLALEFASFAR